MKPFLSIVVLLTAVFAGCQTAHTQNGPQVIVVPQDELSGDTAVGQSMATPTPLPAPAATPFGEAGPAATPILVASTPPATAPVAPAPSAPAAPTEKQSYSDCHVDGPYIAMTFDDGPSTKLTPQLLDMLKERNIKATFFMVGENAATNPEIVKRMVAEGHEVGNHSWNHPALNKLSADGVAKQLNDTSEAIFKACGVRPVVMRPPYGATNGALDRTIRDQYHMKVILWSVDPLDWKVRNSDHVFSEIMKGVAPGAIILSHDIHATTVAAMPRTLDALLAKGYKFVTVSQLIAMDKPVPPPVKKEAPPKEAASATPTPKPKQKKM